MQPAETPPIEVEITPRPTRWKRLGVIVGAAIAVDLLALAHWGAAYRPDLTIPAGRQGTHLSIDGNPLRVFQTGSGPDVLLIHGCPGSIEDWDSILGELTNDFRVTAYDRPGHGYSGWEGDRYGYDYHAGVAERLIDELKLKDVIVVGHSYGGTTALALAARRPTNVKCLVLLDSAAYKLMEPPSALYRALALPGLGVGIARLAGPLVAEKKIRAGLEAQFPGGPPPPGFVEERIKIWNQPKVTTSVAHEYLVANPESATMSSRYREIELPTFVAGQADHPGRRAAAEQLARDIPHAQLELMSGTGHYLQVEKPREVIELIRRAAAVVPKQHSDSAEGGSSR